MKPASLKTDIFLDSGNPEETIKAFSLLGFLDGQTTNPSLVAKNPKILDFKNAHTLSKETIWNEYRSIANEIKTILPDGAISVEVFADKDTSYETMLAQARELANWFSGIYVKLPITATGLQVAETLSREGINVNMTLCFSQEQAAAVHAATKEGTGKVFVSPFIGRLDDHGQSGLDLVKNILRMYRGWGSRVQVLSASIRSVEHMHGCLAAGSNAITAPLSILLAWTEEGMKSDDLMNDSELITIEFQEVIEKSWSEYNIYHELTDQGLEKFVSDWNQLFA